MDAPMALDGKLLPESSAAHPERVNVANRSTAEDIHDRALDEIEAALVSRDFGALGRSLAFLRSSALPIVKPSCIGQTVGRLRESFSKFNNEFLFHGQSTGTTATQLEELIEVLDHADMSPWHVTLMPSLLLLTHIQAILARHLIDHGATAIPAELFAAGEQAIERYRRANPIADAYSHTARAILDYARGQHYSAIDHFRRASESLLHAPDLTAKDHLLWSHRGICNTLAEHEIFDYLQRETYALRPSGFLLAERAPFIVSACCDEKYFDAFADNVVRSFLQHNDTGSMHIHVVLDTRDGLHGLLHWRARFRPEQIKRIGVSWSPVPPILSDLSYEDFADPLRSYFTITRFLLASWLMDLYAAPLFIHDVDMTIAGTWAEHFAWLTAENLSVAHHLNPRLGKCVPWFDTIAGILMIGNTEAGRFYARSLSQVSWYHFCSPLKVRYNIDQNILSSLTRFCHRHVAGFQSKGFEKFPPVILADNDPAFRAIRKSLN